MNKKKTGAIILCLIIGWLATLSTDWQSALFDRTVMGGPMVALLVSMIACNLLPSLDKDFKTGTTFASKKFLNWGIIFTGATLSFADILGTGVKALPLILFNICLSFTIALLVGKKLKVSRNTSILVGGGTCICGGTAIATLSRIIKALEEELGKKLFTRHSFSIQLTEEGMLLRKRAEDLVNMADKIKVEFLALDDVLGGDVYFGLAESYQIRYLASAIRRFKNTYPGLHYHITSGDTEQVTEKLDKGILDFAVLAQEPDPVKYRFLKFPEADLWGAVMPADCPLAGKEAVSVKDLIGLPLFCSEQGWNNDINRWCGSDRDKLQLEGSFRLSYNGSIFVKEGLGCLLTLQNLINTNLDNGLVFRPLTPKLETNIYLIWKKYQVFTPIAERLLEQLKAEFGG